MERVFEKSIAAQRHKKFIYFLEPEGFLSCIQDPANNTNSEPD
jgi:hypothetical protein